MRSDRVKCRAQRRLEPAGVICNDMGLIDPSGVMLWPLGNGERHCWTRIGSSIAWSKEMEQTCSTARQEGSTRPVVAPGLPGFGFTEAPDDYEYTFDAMARTIDALTREVGLERFFLYVHDFGAPVAYYLAMARPDRVLGLIIQNECV